MNEHHLTLELSDQSPLAHGAFSASLVLGGEHSLYDLAAFLIKTVGFDFDHAFEFCDNVKDPYRSKERYTLFADIGETDDPDEPGVKETLVSAVFRPKRKMVFHFDYGDDWFFLVTCTAVKESAAKRKFKKVVSTQGTPPVQYADPDA
jgi:hypothetical protein